MTTMIDSSLWVDYFRTKTPVTVKQQVVHFVDDADAVLCEPVRFEILRAAPRKERKRIEETFATLPLLPTPAELWQDAIDLGQQCVNAGAQPPTMDLLIAAVCLRHDIELITFDSGFADIAKVCPLKVRLLRRAA